MQNTVFFDTVADRNTVPDNTINFVRKSILFTISVFVRQNLQRGFYNTPAFLKCFVISLFPSQQPISAAIMVAISEIKIHCREV